MELAKKNFCLGATFKTFITSSCLILQRLKTPAIPNSHLVLLGHARGILGRSSEAIKSALDYLWRVETCKYPSN